MIVYGQISCTVFVYMLMRDASLKQRIPSTIRVSIFGPFSARKKCALYTGKYGSSKKGVKISGLNGAQTLTLKAAGIIHLKK